MLTHVRDVAEEQSRLAQKLTYRVGGYQQGSVVLFRLALGVGAKFYASLPVLTLQLLLFCKNNADNV